MLVINAGYRFVLQLNRPCLCHRTFAAAFSSPTAVFNHMRPQLSAFLKMSLYFVVNLWSVASIKKILIFWRWKYLMEYHVSNLRIIHIPSNRGYLSRNALRNTKNLMWVSTWSKYKFGCQEKVSRPAWDLVSFWNNVEMFETLKNMKTWNNW